jgi:predicted nucleic acid-binding protein
MTGPVFVDGNPLGYSWTVQDRYGISWWDSLIVAAAARSGAPWLLTEDFQEGQEFFGVTVVNPLATAPDLLPAP